MARSNNFYAGVLFKPSRIRDLTERSEGKILNVSQESSNIDHGKSLDLTASFRYDAPGAPFKSTQQLNVDFSLFENHTFFNSARSKVQVAFNKIFNRYPFDGSFSETINFLDSLSGFEKYVFDSIPKFTGSLGFDRESGGSYLSVNTLFSEKEKRFNNFLGEDKTDIRFSPFTLEFSLFVPEGTINDNEVIIQKIINNNCGFTVALSSSKHSTNPLTEYPLFVGISSGSVGHNFTVPVRKGNFNNIGLVFDRQNSEKIKVYKNGTLSYSSQVVVVGDLNVSGSNLTIGSGSNHAFPGSNFLPKLTLSGAIDELRFFNTARSSDKILKYHGKSIFAEPSLKLYYRFNEPSGSFEVSNSENESLVIDHSGNSLHTNITNFSIGLRNQENFPKKSVYENPLYSPCLFPDFTQTANLAAELISSGTFYDFNNPNLITNLVPKHYLVDDAQQQGLSEFGNLDIAFDLTDKFNEVSVPSSQIISTILFMWAEKFDEMKMFIDEFMRLIRVDYKTDETISDQMLPFLANYYGLQMPALFRESSSGQYRDGEDVLLNPTANSETLQKIQNSIWRRILADINSIIKRKGTIDSIESVLRNMGIGANSPYRIKEYGGSTTTVIRDFYENRQKNLGNLVFSGPNPVLQTSYLSASRVEPGKPLIAGSFVDGISDNPSDGLFTSGSWNASAIFEVGKIYQQAVTQSLMRIQTTGSENAGHSVGHDFANDFVIFNLLATNNVNKNGSKGNIKLFGRPSQNGQVLSMSLSANIFDGNKWRIGFGRTRNDLSGSGPKLIGSKYHLRASRTGISGLTEIFTTSSFFSDMSNNALNTINSIYNASGSYLAIGSQSMGMNYSNAFLNGTSFLADVKNFSGKVSNIRFFSKALTEKESDTHARNPRSSGVEDPTYNFNFNITTPGSFERLRSEITVDQIHQTTDSDGNLKLEDFSQNKFFARISGFNPNTRVIRPERFDYQILSPKFEIGSTFNKIRTRSFKSPNLVIEHQASSAPLYELSEAEKPLDDRRVGVEISIAQALNDDIVNIFGTLEFFDKAIGSPEMVFAEEYRDLRNLRKVYFNRLQNKINSKKFFEFFKWFDNTVGDIIEDLIPSTSRYVGTNFVIESHMLERQKMVYRYQDMYIGELDRLLASSIFLQQFLIDVRKR